MVPRILCPSSLVAALLVLAAVRADPDAPRPAAPATCPEAQVSAHAACPEDQPGSTSLEGQAADHDPRLVGLWHRYPEAAEGEPLRFYYFHDEGFGIYRYGRVGLTNTHSFDWSTAGGALDLRFRKTGEHAAPRYHLEHDAAGTWLVVEDDPREAGAAVRYLRAPDPTAACDSGPLVLMPGLLGPSGGALGGRLWGEEQRYATGGMGFAIYQLQAQAIDGRGVGWYHRGDYDEWVTESLTYRQQADHLALAFTLRHEGHGTAIRLGEAPDGTRTLTLADDPRDFWRPHTYRDMGPSFATCP
jgi:hypothetical protein